MGHSHGTREVEIKLALDSAAAGKRLLKKAGLRLSRRRVFEANTVFDDRRRQLRKAGTLLRVREVKGRGILTYKGPTAPGRHKSREEIETSADPAALRAILGRLGFEPVFRYEKYRAEYTDGGGAAMLDETPAGCFLELEGSPAWIDRTARALGFDAADYITASYLRLYLEDCRRRGIRPADMVFAPAAKRRPRV